MSPSPAPLIIHGMPASQPCRAVYWTCLIQGLPFELRPVGLDDPTARERLVELNPSGQVPTIEDRELSLYEMPAILIYLCEKHGWSELLPANLETRARIHQYLHFHHSFTRRATRELMAPHVTVAFAERMRGTAIGALIDDPDRLEKGRATVREIAGMIERGYLRDGPAHLCTPHPTIADIACYEELAQLRWAELYDFAEFPTLRRWLDAMAKLPFHDEAHRYNLALGDIRTRPNTIERFMEANAAGVEALRVAR